MNSITKQWIERADYDSETADAMFKTGRYLYVAFMCQQTVEKHLKAIIQEKTGQIPPYTHNLPLLYKLSGINLTTEQQEFLIILGNYYLNTRYLDFKQKLFENIDRNKAQDCLVKTRELIRCLKKELRI